MQQAMGPSTERQQLEHCLSIIAMLQEHNAELENKVRTLQGKLDAQNSSLANLLAENDILKRRLFGRKSEHTNSDEFQLLIQGLLPEEDKLQKEYEQRLSPGHNPVGGENDAQPDPEPAPKPRPKPNGRRNLAFSKLPRIEVIIDDPELAEQGRFIRYDDAHQLIHFRGGFRVLVKRTAVYEVEVNGNKTVLGATQPKRLFPRSLCHTSVYAWLAYQKFGLGVPHYRLEQQLKVEEESLDRGTMSRYMEDLGGTLGATVVHAMFEDARTNCHVINTDATGAAIQPAPAVDGRRQACDKGHFFAVLADCDHVLFAYTESHTSKAVAALFTGFSGYLQSDASSVYNILERGPPGLHEDELQLVGCWAHLRRYFFEAAVCKYAEALEGLRQIREIYRVDGQFRKFDAATRKRLRLEQMAPLFDRFFAWVKQTLTGRQERTKLTQALKYALNQQWELRRVLDDGKLQLDNNRSERALRTIVVGRKNWLFYGSDVHAESAAAIFTILASCRLHRLDPQAYLCDVLRVLPYWPKDRYIELSPLHWRETRARLSEEQLANPVCEIDVPPPLLASAAAA